MPVPKLALVVLGLGAVAYVATRKKAAPTPTTPWPPKPGVSGGLKGIPGGTTPDEADLPMCSKYPAGGWLPGYDLKGSPKGNIKGWNEEENARAWAIAKQYAKNAPPYKSITDARTIAFNIVHAIVKTWCPVLDRNDALPSKIYNKQKYLDRSVALQYMWGRLDTMVWNLLVGDPGGGN